MQLKNQHVIKFDLDLGAMKIIKKKKNPRWSSVQLEIKQNWKTFFYIILLRHSNVNNVMRRFDWPVSYNMSIVCRLICCVLKLSNYKLPELLSSNQSWFITFEIFQNFLFGLRVGCVG